MNLTQFNRELSDRFQELEKNLETELRSKASQEGHRLTGTLENSIEVISVPASDGVDIQGKMANYGVFLSKGIPPDRVPYYPGSGNTTSKFIDGLKEFVRLRRLATLPREILSIAFRIARVAKKVGLPIRTKGKGTRWIESTLTQNAPRIEKEVSAQCTEVVSRAFGDALENLVKSNPNLIKL